MDYKIRNLTLEKTNAKSEKLLPYLDYSKNIEVDEYGNHLLKVSIKPSYTDANGTTHEFKNENLTSGSFSFKATFTLNKVAGQQANIRVSLVPAKNFVMNAKVSGSIDLVNRAGTSVTVKPVLRNLNGTVSGMYFKDDAHNLFNDLYS